MLIPPSDSNLSSDDRDRARNSPRAPWVLILPLALAAGVLLQQSQDSTLTDAGSTITNTATNATTNTTQNDDKLRGELARYFLFVPDDNGDLRRETAIDKNWRVSKEDIEKDDYQVRSQAATRAVKMLMQRHSDDFPQGAQLLNDAQVKNDVTTLNFNRNFADAAFWQGSTRTLSSVYSIVNTALESQKLVLSNFKMARKEGEMQLQVEGQPISTLGELDTQSPIKSDLKMVAPQTKPTVSTR